MNKRTEKKFQAYMKVSDKQRETLPRPDGIEQLQEGELKRFVEGIARQAFAAGVNLERARGWPR